jgi:arylsulfatase A-like enzyme
MRPGITACWRAAFLLALAGCGDQPPQTASANAPNVLLISLDSVRADQLGAYRELLGRAPGRSPSPSLDRLAAEGVLVTEALATTSWTLPSHVTLFTGLPELVHGVEQDGQALAPELPTLAEELQARGYRTFGVYSGPYLDPRFGLSRGFERYVAGYGPELAAAAERAAGALERVHALDNALDRAQRYAILEQNAEAERALEVASHRDVSSRTVSDRVIAELATAAGDERPFFVFAHYFDPHYDYVPPAPFDALLDPDYRGTVDGQDFARRLADPTLVGRDLEHLRALHDGELAWTDSEIGRVLAELERLDLSADTLVVVVADHGEEFLEHGGLGHRRTLYEEVLRVPMILRLPGRLPAGLRPRGPVSLAALLPTVLALVDGAPEPLAALEDRAPALARLVLNPTGEREDMRVLESFQHGSLKLLRRCTLGSEGARAREELSWIDLVQSPGETSQDWSSDFGSAAARTALLAFRETHARLVQERRCAPLATKAEDLLSAFRGLGYAGEEARVGALPGEELVLPPPGEAVLAGEGSGDGR